MDYPGTGICNADAMLDSFFQGASLTANKLRMVMIRNEFWERGCLQRSTLRAARCLNRAL